MNGFIFCLLTPRVRQKLCCFPYCWRGKKEQDAAKITSPLTETMEQKRLLENVDISFSNRYSSSVNDSLSSSSDSYDN